MIFVVVTKSDINFVYSIEMQEFEFFFKKILLLQSVFWGPNDPEYHKE